MNGDWQQERARLIKRIEELERLGICYSCKDLETGEVFGRQFAIYEDGSFKVVLDPYPRASGHAIVVYKPHRDDFSHISEREASRLFALCLRITRAIKRALGAEKVYIYSMCDGRINHLHVQLLPRYRGEPIGSKRFVAERQPLVDGEGIVQRIRAAIEAN